MTIPFPHHYEVDLAWESGRHGVLSAPPRPNIPGGPPPQFDGQDIWWSPEHLLLSSLSLCYMTTLLALSDKAKLTITDLNVHCDGILDKSETGINFTALILNVRLKVPAGEKDRTEKLLVTAKKYCIISNSLKPPIELKFVVTGL